MNQSDVPWNKCFSAEETESAAGRKDFSRKQHKLGKLAGRFLENGFVQ